MDAGEIRDELQKLVREFEPGTLSGRDAFAAVRVLTDDEAQLHLEGVLDSSERARVEKHLGVCPGCQALVLSFEALSESLSALPQAEPPAGFTAAVMARIGEREIALQSQRRAAIESVGFAGNNAHGRLRDALHAGDPDLVARRPFAHEVALV